MSLRHDLLKTLLNLHPHPSQPPKAQHHPHPRIVPHRVLKPRLTLIMETFQTPPLSCTAQYCALLSSSMIDAAVSTCPRSGRVRLHRGRAAVEQRLWPPSGTRWSSVHLSTFGACASAPWSSSSRMTSIWPPSGVRWSGVHLSSSCTPASVRCSRST